MAFGKYNSNKRWKMRWTIKTLLFLVFLGVRTDMSVRFPISIWNRRWAVQSKEFIDLRDSSKICFRFECLLIPRNWAQQTACTNMKVWLTIAADNARWMARKVPQIRFNVQNQQKHKSLAVKQTFFVFFAGEVRLSWETMLIKSFYSSQPALFPAWPWF